MNIMSALITKAGHEIEEFDLQSFELPFYNQDIEDVELPDVVVKMKKKIESADVILLASPEYNHSVTGILKNMIDWASRPYGANSFNGKKVLIVGASPGKLGSARGQKHLREILEPLSVKLVGEPDEVCISNAYEAFDDNDQFVNEEDLEKVKKLMQKI